jgi:transcriptional regulator with XRE-family HTH domain
MSQPFDQAKIGANLKEYRIKAGYKTQQQVATLLQIERSVVCKIEKGSRKISGVELHAFCELYGCTPIDILEEKEGEQEYFCNAVIALEKIVDISMAARESILEIAKEALEREEISMGRFREIENKLKAQISRPIGYEKETDRAACQKCIYLYEVCHKSSTVGWRNICGKNIQGTTLRLKELSVGDLSTFNSLVEAAGVDGFGVCNGYKDAQDTPSIQIYHGKIQ